MLFAPEPNVLGTAGVPKTPTTARITDPHPELRTADDLTTSGGSYSTDTSRTSVV